MARASSAKTWLPLDRWAQVLNIDPYAFNGLTHEGCAANSCTGLWYQHIQHSNKLGREAVAIAISDAERLLSDFVGYNLLPDWDTFDGNPPRYHDPLYYSNVTAQYRPKSVRLPKGYVLAGGVRTKTLIEAGATVTPVDNDNDGFSEIATVEVESECNPNYIKVYYAGKNYADAYEIRPITISSSGDTHTISFPRYQSVKLSLQDILCTPDELAYNNADNYETTVDVVCVTNDTTTDPVNLIYLPDINCQSDCTEIAYTDCLNVVDYTNGYVRYNRQLRREPDRLNINYYSGWTDNSLERPYSDLDLFWEVAITALSVSLLDSKVHCCGGNNCAIASRWAQPMNILTKASETQYLVTQIMLNNPFGIVTEGSWFAYQRAFTRKLR